MSRDLLEKLTVSQLVNKFPAYYGNRRFITAFTSARHMSYQSISPGLRLSVWVFRNNIRFYGEELLAPRPTPKLEDHSLSAFRDCLFNIFASTLHTGGSSSIDRNPLTFHRQYEHASKLHYTYIACIKTLFHTTQYIALIFCWPCISIYLFLNINQLDALNFYNNFISSLYMFRAHVLIVRRVKIVLYSLWYHHTYRWPSGAPDGHL